MVAGRCPPRVQLGGERGVRAPPDQHRWLRRNAADGGISASWSPDGTKIAHAHGGEIFVVDVNGTVGTNLTNSAFDDAEPDWSPDGSQIVFQSTRDGKTDIYVMKADGTAVTRLTTDPAADTNPSW